MGNLKLIAVILGIITIGVTTAMAAEKDCVECHTKVTPGIVTQHLDGEMAKSGKVGCITCHDDKHKTMNDAELARMPTAQLCARCHPKRAEEYSRGKHNLAWTASSGIHTWSHRPSEKVGTGFKSDFAGSNEACIGCHKIGVKTKLEMNKYTYGNAQCDSCHTRHSFKISEARDPRTCQTCHMGFDHPQWEMWSSSKHGSIWQIEGSGSKRAPTCQTCHMPNGNHNSVTAWGYLALRLPENDGDWLKDRMTIFQALGFIDESWNPTKRMGMIKDFNLARLSKEEFQGLRKQMEDVCTQCHGSSYVKHQLSLGDLVVRNSDKVLAEAIRIVQGLYKDGFIKKPADWDYAPDLFNYYKSNNLIEQELHQMFLNYRMKAIKGAFHNNPEYTHWYGWAPLAESLSIVKNEAKKLRNNKK